MCKKLLTHFLALTKILIVNVHKKIYKFMSQQLLKIIINAN
jgi:hypothetical protein